MKLVVDDLLGCQVRLPTLTVTLNKTLYANPSPKPYLELAGDAFLGGQVWLHTLSKGVSSLLPHVSLDPAGVNTEDSNPLLLQRVRPNRARCTAQRSTACCQGLVLKC